MNSETPNLLTTLRSDQVGSLLRPESLKQAFSNFAAGEGALRRAQEDAIRDVIAMQESRGLAVLTDGEFRRRGFQDSFSEAVTGYETGDAPQPAPSVEIRPHERIEQHLGAAGPAIARRRPAKQRLELVRNLPLEEYSFASSLTEKPLKVTLIGPDRISQRFAYEQSRDVYAGMDAFLTDVIAIERQMISELVAAGCRYVQIDAPGFTAYVDPPSLAQMQARCEDPETNLRRSIDAENAVIEGFPGVTFGIHICRGNERSMWHRAGHYDAIAEQLFAGLNHQRLLLEYDSDRAGGFEPLRYVTKGKVAVLGLITTKVPKLETVDELRRRIDAAARHLPLEQLALSPQCGFASGLLGNLLSEDDQWRKLDVMLETAERVWGAR